MRLIGMMDSPYVRRVAVSMNFLRLSFTHEAVSVFRHYEQFAAINPVVKAPTLITADGTVLMESTLILEYLEALGLPAHRLTPSDRAAHARAQRIIGLALAACEKTVQLVYEFNLRPEDKRHQPWIDRVQSQLQTAYALLESECTPAGDWLLGERVLQADITAAVAWAFTQYALPERISPKQHPALVALARRVELLPEFSSAPLA
jgi:glutathione S-transferase